MSYPPPSSPEQPPQYGAPIPPSFPPAQPGYGQPVPPPKKSNTGMIVGIIVGVVLLVCVVCSVGLYIAFNRAADEVKDTVDEIQSSLGVTKGPKVAGPHTVRYEVGGTGNALVNWSRSAGGTENETGPLPWTKEITFNGDSFGAVLIVFGRDSSADDQGITCKILVDGVEKVSRSGPKSATCTMVYVS